MLASLVGRVIGRVGGFADGWVGNWGVGRGVQCAVVECGLAFAGMDPSYDTQVKLGVLGGSLIAGNGALRGAWFRLSLP